jgi:hypothetical protein
MLTHFEIIVIGIIVSKIAYFRLINRLDASKGIEFVLMNNMYLKIVIISTPKRLQPKK